MSRNGKKRKKGPIIALVLLALVLLAGVVLVKNYKNFNYVNPPQYKESIVRYSNEFGVDPYFTAAVINTESGFDPNAVSHAGAMGLMQIMPETGEWIAGKLGVDDYSKNRLLEPELNIRFGCWYLNFLKERFDGDNKLMSAGYNAGHNRVDGWLDDRGISGDGLQLDNIPFEETDRYVKKVMHAFEVYKENYEIS